jgi:hypothetical protein
VNADRRAVARQSLSYCAADAAAAPVTTAILPCSGFDMEFSN